MNEIIEEFVAICVVISQEKDAEEREELFEEAKDEAIQKLAKSLNIPIHQAHEIFWSEISKK